LTAAGLAPDAAQAAAAAAFGKPGEWACGILISENTPPYLRTANIVSIAGFTLFLLATPIFALMMMTFHRGPNTPAIVVLAVAALSFLAATLGAAIARRCAVKSLIVITAAAAFFTYLVIGISTEPLTKGMRQRMVITQAQDSIHADLQKLQLGTHIYGSSALPPAVPETLNMDGGFVAPVPGSRTLPLTALANGATEVVMNQEVAAQRWRDFGAQRLAECQHALIDLEHHPILHMTVWQALSPIEASNFDAAIGLKASGVIGVQGAVCLALCGLSALLGRLFHRGHTAWLQQRKVRRALIN
jgi:hypothetical protein